MSEVVLTLPDDLATEAKKMGLFNPTLAASIFRAELRKRRTNKFFSMLDEIADDADQMSEEEVMEEVRAARRERKLRTK